jgi:hypothetical protein
MDILKHPFPIKSLIFCKLNCHAKMAPDIRLGHPILLRTPSHYHLFLWGSCRTTRLPPMSVERNKGAGGHVLCRRKSGIAFEAKKAVSE